MRAPIAAPVAAVVAAAAVSLIAMLPWGGVDAAVNVAPTAPVVESVSSNCPRTILSARRIDAHATRYSTTYLYWVTARRTCADGSTETYYYQEWRNS